MIPSLPDVLTFGRLLLSPIATGSLLLALAGHGPWLVPLAVLLVAAASDAADGSIARRLGTAGLRGRRLDAIADIALLLPALALLAYAGILPLLLPVAVTLAFSLFASSLFWFPRRLPSKPALADRIGHLGGMGNWLTACLGSVAAAPLARPALLSLAYLVGVLDTMVNLSAALLHLHSLARARQAAGGRSGNDWAARAPGPSSQR